MADLDVETCDSALAAVKKITQTEYDAVVTDIKMPGMDGLALLKEIRTLRPELPTLLITGHGQHDLAVQALRGGAFDFIQKPIDREYVVASLSRAIRVRKLDRQLQQQQAALANHAAELEQAVEERTEQLRMANRRKDEFLATLSHELRNPLAPIRSGLEILKMEGKSDQEIIDLMQEQLLHLVRLVDDLMDTSRMMQGKIELRKESVDLLKLIDQSVKTIRPNIEARGQEFVSDLPKQPIWLHADPVRIVQIIENLLNNAVKYTDPGGRIELAAGCENGQAVFSVRDTGIGIESELLPNIFELFTQSSRSLDRAQGGLGIGLTLVQRLVELHDGSITAQSEGPGQGSTFVVRMPVKTIGGVTRPANATDRSSEKRRIAVVDDNIGAARLLSALLVKSGQHEVETALDGPSALEMIQQFAPEIVFLDIGLPGMDGFQVARTLREMHEFRHIILVALSGYGQDVDFQMSKEAGFDKHLVKPVQYTELEDVLAEFQQNRC
jgi:signal transduction histidine kinase